jgi:hypothetical protein
MRVIKSIIGSGDWIYGEQREGGTITIRSTTISGEIGHQRSALIGWLVDHARN